MFDSRTCCDGFDAEVWTKERDPQAKIPGLVDFGDSVNDLMNCIDNSSKETTRGGFRDWAGETIPW